MEKKNKKKKTICFVTSLNKKRYEIKKKIFKEKMGVFTQFFFVTTGSEMKMKGPNKSIRKIFGPKTIG